MIKKYLAYRSFALILWLSATFFGLAVALLGGVVRPIALYGLLIAVFLAATFCIIDYIVFVQRTARLQVLLQNISCDPSDPPWPANEIERLYNEIIEELYAGRKRDRDRLGEQLQSQQEYYTIWLHQIKTPIAAMSLGLEPGAHYNRQLLQGELFNIERYVDMALQFSRLENIAGDLVLSDCPLDPIISETVKKYRSVFIGKNLSVDFKKTGLTLVSDPKWLSFILGQLLSNAAKYTGSGVVKIYLDGDRLAVEDSGIGVRSDDLARIFERGYTGLNGRNDKRASGLGLYLSRRAADALHVTVDCEPNRSCGARFFIGLKNIIKR